MYLMRNNSTSIGGIINIYIYMIYSPSTITVFIDRPIDTNSFDKF